MTSEQIIELATKELKYHYRPYQEPYWYGNKEQLIKFAEKIYEEGYDDGCYQATNSTEHTGLVGDPQ